MNSEQEKILIEATNYWNKHFTGISAISISQKLGLEHAQVLRTLGELKRKGFGNMNLNVTLYLASIDGLLSGSEFKSKKVVTNIFFPSKRVLESEYRKNILKHIDKGEFKKRLHRGFNQMDHFFSNLMYLKNIWIIQNSIKLKMRL